MRALALAFGVLLMLVAVLGFGLALVTAMVVSAVRHRLMWSEPGLPMHELIAPTGELQDPQYGDRRRRPSLETACRRRESTAVVPLMSRAPWTVQKGARSVHHG
jgi:hypothetical protein